MSRRQGQCRGRSLLEAMANVVVGFGLAVLTQVAVFPAFGIAVSAASHLGIASTFTVLSLVRSYLLRRVFERLGGGTIP